MSGKQYQNKNVGNDCFYMLQTMLNILYPFSLRVTVITTLFIFYI